MLARVGAIAGPLVTRTARQPASAIPPLIFPVALMLINSGGLKASTLLPGFPTDSFLAFALAVPFIQGALFSTMNAGTDLARDIQTGFFSRLALTPIRGAALLTGQPAGIITLGVLQAVFYITPGSPVRRRSPAGRVALVYAAHVSLGSAPVRPVPDWLRQSSRYLSGALRLLFSRPMNTPGTDRWFRV
jgi:ABC-2 type transport system permease protein